MGRQVNEHEQLCGCEVCANDRDFEMPRALVDACMAGELVIFAGAGTSTEQGTVLPYTLYDEVVDRIEGDIAPGMAFPSVMTRFEAEHGRMALLQVIKARLDYVRSFPYIDDDAGRFASALSSVFTVGDIVTTNWDTYFETHCAAQPFVTEEDWAFWHSSERKVFKLHGSISSPGSVIATEADYKRCYRNLNQGLIGAQLKTMLATKTVVFVGYSLQDSDFTKLYRLMRRRMKEILPRAYIVTLDDSEPVSVARDMHVIRTSGVNFISKLKSEFSEDELLPDERFEAIPMMREFVGMLHHEMIDQGEMREDPAMLLCASYHDGLLDAFSHQIANQAAGKYSHRCYAEGLFSTTYRKLRDERQERGAWIDVAYIEGYRNGLLFLGADDDARKGLPLYYVVGADDLVTEAEFRKAAKNFKRAEPDAFEHARAQAAKLGPGVVFQHRPTLL